MQRDRVQYFLGLAILWLGVASNAHAAPILMDFSASGGSGGPGGTWNVYAQPTNLTGTLVDSTGANTGVSIGITGQWTNSGNAGASLTFDNNLESSGLCRVASLGDFEHPE